MSVTSEATATWSGSLKDGSGSVDPASGIGTFPVDWRARSEGAESTTTPEELIAAAHSSCFNMALSNELGQAGFTPDNVRTTASVTFVPGTGVTGSHLNVSASVPGISEDEFQKIAEGAKSGCPISQALAGIDITIEASLA
ncbi:peroxiredoxin [Microbacterium faecale]|uniref:Peroxiredoxin n=1 Tax=Microbacterium faecale TaxID=1804630 RepID=A0A916YGI2_9MICO|nr:OsmC family peroxiredoxin [Microbacterium faecale]GGD43884.1 peroxiredoxin [Microbacterium faecale]